MDLVNAPETSLRDEPALALLEKRRAQADPRKILADRVEQLYDQLWIAILAVLVVGSIATFELWEPRYQGLVLFWWGLVLLTTLASASLLLGYRRSRNKLEQADHWLRRLGLAALDSITSGRIAPSRANRAPFGAVIGSSSCSASACARGSSWNVRIRLGYRLLKSKTATLRKSSRRKCQRLSQD